MNGAMQEPIHEVIQEMRGGDFSHFQLFHEATHRKMHYIAYGLLSSHEEAEDVTQDAYVRFVERIHSYKDGTNPYAFLATIVRNLAYDELRRRDRETVEYDEGLDGREEESPKEDIDRLLAPLTPLEREVVTLHVLDELKFREVASVMGKSLSAVLVTYHRAIRKLRKEAGKE